jgi:hypothetical protein
VRAAAEVELADIKAREDQDSKESGLVEYLAEWTRWMNNETMAERASILAQVKREWSQPPAPVAPETLTDSKTSAAPLAPDAPWHRMLDAMIAGDQTGTESASGEMLRDTPSAGCFAMAAIAIARNSWEEAQIWVDQAWQHGTPEENAAFGEVLTNLGWMQPGAKQLIPPEAETAARDGVGP